MPAARPSATPVIPSGQELDAAWAGQVKAKKVAALPAEQRKWSDNILKALKLKSKGSQARVMAGAMAGASQVEARGGADAAEAKRLLKIVQNAGDPPWKDAKRAMQATDAAAQIGLLSIPADQRKLQPIGGGTANTTFTINRVDADGVTRPAFLCKPGSEGKMGPKVEGIPDFGEVIREAVVGRAAQTFTAQTGIDIGMPESHVVKIAASSIPGHPPSNEPVTCSIQEWGAGLQPVKDLPPGANAAFRSDKIAALAVFDLMTLNTDRHSGNIMSDGQGSMLPIDHGASFPEGLAGKKRILQTLGGAHNALLQMPGAFDPMPDTMVKSLRAMKSSNYKASLKKDRNDVASSHADMKGMISDEALDWAGKAARFAKLAARHDPPLSPGSMQVLFGGAADFLLDAEDFDKTANVLIAQAAPNTAVIKAVCTSDDSEYAELCRQVEALGWSVQLRGASDQDQGISDPSVMLAIIEGQVQHQAAGRNDDEGYSHHKAQRAPIYNAMPGPDTLRDRWLELRKQLIVKYIALMPTGDRATPTAALNALSGTPDEQMAASAPLMQECRLAATMNQLEILNTRLAANPALEKNWVIGDVREAAMRDDPIEMSIKMSQVN